MDWQVDPKPVFNWKVENFCKNHLPALRRRIGAGTHHTTCVTKGLGGSVRDVKGDRLQAAAGTRSVASFFASPPASAAFGPAKFHMAFVLAFSSAGIRRPTGTRRGGPTPFPPHRRLESLWWTQPRPFGFATRWKDSTRTMWSWRRPCCRGSKSFLGKFWYVFSRL